MIRTTKDWVEIEIYELKDDHLINIYNMIEKMAEKWITVQAWWWVDYEDMRYDEWVISWEDVWKSQKEYLEIRKEYNKRFLSL